MKAAKTRPEIIREFYVLAGDPQGIRYGELAEVWFDQAACTYLDGGMTAFGFAQAAGILSGMVSLLRSYEMHEATMRGQLAAPGKSWLQRLRDILTLPTLSTGPR
jgi:hypothetical protein